MLDCRPEGDTLHALAASVTETGSFCGVKWRAPPLEIGQPPDLAREGASSRRLPFHLTPHIEMWWAGACLQSPNSSKRRRGCPEVRGCRVISHCWKAQWPVVGSWIQGSISTEPWIHLPALCLACGDAAVPPLSSLLISFSEEAGMHQPATPPPMKEALPLKSRHCIDLCRSITNRHHLYRSPYAAHLHHPRFQPATTVCLEARESTLQRCAPVNQWPVTTMRRAPLADAPSPSAFCHFTSLHPGRLTMVDG